MEKSPWSLGILSFFVIVTSTLGIASLMASPDHAASPTQYKAETGPSSSPAALPETGSTSSDRQKPTQPEKDAKTDEMPTWARYVSWALVGCFGAYTLRVFRNGNTAGLTFVLLIFGVAVWSIVRSCQSGVSIWPPILGLFVMSTGFVGRKE
jgi:lipopolysaccharide export LptBFGC system permease protein LptF